MHYPNGKKQSVNAASTSVNETIYSNRGMTLEADINATNQFYLQTNQAIIHKKPTPVQIVRVDYPRRSAAVIKEAYFKQASTTDYNGIYKGRYIDFEAKETKNKTSFPFHNIHEHQIDHMKQVVEHGAICFILIRFSLYQKTYFYPAERLFDHWENQFNGGRKSISIKTIEKEGYIIPIQYQARVDYLKIIEQYYI
ncbi:Holliday junction resolvase RecU [Gracilibacillus dipsosauri]|uniref:Holliday junction resolvase RecU n=1 Tax=Gracilibacillus dipsosauri TaxID=178340 RepID=A0A317KZ97_9BACI|nr:Holliday junction resolvase RecU [Gracilibacillus dipsosauri]PWU68673.1 Holliday junction resolvase RecU [Gracilibacillus dipsosauri]